MNGFTIYDRDLNIFSISSHADVLGYPIFILYIYISMGTELKQRAETVKKKDKRKAITVLQNYTLKWERKRKKKPNDKTEMLHTSTAISSARAEWM